MREVDASSSISFSAELAPELLEMPQKECEKRAETLSAQTPLYPVPPRSSPNFETINTMRKVVFLSATVLVCAATLSSKDKYPKVTYHEMALGMRDAFNCGLVIEQHLHGPLKDNPESYKKQRDENNCDHVETVLNTLNDQDGATPGQ